MDSAALQDFSLAFLSIIFEGAPFILLGTIISGFIDVYLPSETMDRLLPRKRNRAVFIAAFLGMIFPVCECAVVPVIRRLVAKGLPLGCALSYMIAAPIVNPITALSTWKAFQGQDPFAMTCGRLFLGYLIAVAIGCVVTRLSTQRVIRKSMLGQIEGMDQTFQRRQESLGRSSPSVLRDDAKLIAAMRSAQRDFIEVGIYFSIGVAITALFNTGIAPGAVWLDQVADQSLLAPAALMALAFVLSLCSSSDAFIAASLAKFTWAAKLAFLVFGPIMDLKLLFLYQTLLRRRFILFFALSVFVFLWIFAFAWEEFFGDFFTL